MTKYPAIEIIGAPGSPYTRKMIALLRYRRIEHTVHWGDPGQLLQARGLPKPKVALLPTLLVHQSDETEVLIDSTPIIRVLDTQFKNRCLRPKSDPALALIDSLIEDFADEWGTKLMFHYRWNFQADIDLCAHTLPLGMAPQLTNDQAMQFGKTFAERQIGRLRYVGSNETTAPIIEAAYQRLLTLLDALLEQQRFFLGNRPGAGDFAWFGQLSQLALYDPTPRQLAGNIAPRLVAWTSTMEDLSGLEVTENQWQSTDQLKAMLKPLLSEIGLVYTPLLLANASAVAEGQPRWQAEIAGAVWEQDTFPYQAKCLQALQEEYGQLTPLQQRSVMELLAGTGCQTMFEGAPVAKIKATAPER